MRTELVSLYFISCLNSIAVYLYCPCPHQSGATTRIQVDQIFPMGSILAHLLIPSSFKELNQSDTYVMCAIGKRFEGVVPFHGRTQQ